MMDIAMITEVNKLLSYEDKANATLVCRRWRNIFTYINKLDYRIIRIDDDIDLTIEGSTEFCNMVESFHKLVTSSHYGDVTSTYIIITITSYCPVITSLLVKLLNFSPLRIISRPLIINKGCLKIPRTHKVIPHYNDVDYLELPIVIPIDGFNITTNSDDIDVTHEGISISKITYYNLITYENNCPELSKTLVRIHKGFSVNVIETGDVKLSNSIISLKL
jgi:hypothetical protein